MIMFHQKCVSGYGGHIEELYLKENMIEASIKNNIFCLSQLTIGMLLYSSSSSNVQIEIVLLLRSCQTACQNTFQLLQTFTCARIISADCPRISGHWACWLSSTSARNHGSLSFSCRTADVISKRYFSTLYLISKYLSEKYKWLPCFRINCWSFLILSQIWRA